MEAFLRYRHENPTVDRAAAAPAAVAARPEEQSRRTTMEACLSEAFEFARNLKRAYDNGAPQDRKRVNDRLSEGDSMEEAPTAGADDPLLPLHETAHSEAKDLKPSSSSSSSSSSKDDEQTADWTGQDGSDEPTPARRPGKQHGRKLPPIPTAEDNVGNWKSTAKESAKLPSPPPMESRPPQMRYPFRSRDHARDHAHGEDSGNSSDSSHSSSSGISDDTISDHLKRKKRPGRQRKKAAAVAKPTGPNYLREKIVLLPLPQSLISYLLYHREV